MKKKRRKNSQEKFIKFLERLSRMLDPSLFRDVEKTFVERPTTFRINTLKSNREEVLTTLKQEGFKVKQVPWYKDAFILENKSKRELTKLNIYEDGKLYIQSLASMAPVLALDPQPGEKVLDLTAAPGSKTSQIAAMMQKQGELVANDKNKVRFFKLKHNMEKLGVTERHPERNGVESKDPPAESNWYVTLRLEPGQKLAREYEYYFDKILLDAPCSAEARFCKNKPKTFAYWREGKIKEMAYTQRKLLFAAWHALKPGGTLVYSTCTFAPEENEVQISRFLERTEDAKIVDITIDIHNFPVVKEWKGKTLHKEIAKAFRIKPTKEIEGFFIAKLQKKA